jgi:hypothetical protein
LALRKLRLERLPLRALLAGVTGDAFDGIATISGSPENDEIIIAPMLQREEVHIFDKVECISAWPQSDLREINVRSFEGDDLSRVADPVTVPVKTAGGFGTDTVLVSDPRAPLRGWVFDVEQAMTESASFSVAALSSIPDRSSPMIAWCSTKRSRPKPAVLRIDCT